MATMPSVDEVVEAFRAIEQARTHYRQLLRACIEEGTADGRTGRQAEISRRIGRTRETLRQDAMTDEELAELRRAEAERRQKAKAAAPAKRTRKAAK